MNYLIFYIDNDRTIMKKSTNSFREAHQYLSSRIKNFDIDRLQVRMNASDGVVYNKYKLDEKRYYLVLDMVSVDNVNFVLNGD